MKLVRSTCGKSTNPIKLGLIQLPASVANYLAILAELARLAWFTRILAFLLMQLQVKISGQLAMILEW